MLLTAVVSIPMAMRATKTATDATAEAGRKPADNRFVAWCALYVLLWGVLNVGLTVGAWHFY